METTKEKFEATGIKITKQTYLINEVIKREEVIGYELVISVDKGQSWVGGKSKFFNADGSKAYKAQMEGYATKRIFDRGEWL